MNHEAQQRIEHLSKRIRLIKEVNNYPLKDRNVLDLENIWRLGDLLSELIYHSELETPALTKKILEEQYNLFVERDKFSLKELLERHWIRIVMERVEIPSVIRSASRDAEKMKPDRIDLITAIANTIEKSAEKCITEVQLIEILDNYNLTSSQIPVNLFEAKKLVDPKWLNQDLYVLKTSSEYFLLLKKEQCSFKFIRQIINDFKLGDKNPYKISKEKANEIVEKHRILYPDCPTLINFVNDMFFTEVEDSVHFMISYTSKHNYWDALSDTIGGKLWNRIKSDTKYKNNNERLEDWLDKLFVNHSYATNCIKYIEQKSCNEFLTLIEERVLNEADIQGCDEELNKLWLEESLDRSIEILVNPIKIRFNDKQSATEKYILVNNLQKGQHDFFYSNYCRKRIDFLLHILIGIGEPFENPKLAFPIIIKLLKESTDKPYLLWELTSLITHIRPEIIPYLFLESDLDELGMKLIGTIALSQHSVSFDNKVEFGVKMGQSKIYEDALMAFLHSNSSYKNNTIGQTIARLIMNNAQSLFYKPFGNNQDARLSKQIEVDAYNRFWDIISNFETMVNVYPIHGSEKPKYFHVIIDSFIEEITKENEPESFNEFYSPSIWKIEVLIRVLEILLNNKYLTSSNKITLENVESKVVKFIQQEYFNYFNKSKIKVRGHSTVDVEERDLKFNEPFGLEWISWNLYFESLNDEQREAFYSIGNPNFEISKFKDEDDLIYDSETEIKIKRLRFHVQVMLKIYNELIEKKDIREELQENLENKLKHIFVNYSSTKIAENKIDIFGKRNEWFTENHLLDDFIKSANSFKEINRREIIDSIVSNEICFDRVLLASNIFTADGDQEYLNKEISQEKLDNFLNKQHWAPDIENTLKEAINNKKLTTLAERIIEFIEKNFNENIKKDKGHQLFMCSVKLLLSFHNKKIKQLDKIPFDELKWRGPYYKALIMYYNGEIENGIKQIESIGNIDSNVDVINALFTMQIDNMVIKHKNDFKKRNEHLKEYFGTYDRRLQNIEESQKDNARIQLIFNKMNYFNLVEIHEGFDANLSQLSRIERKAEGFAELIAKNKIQRGHWKEATEFINDLVRFHTHRNQELPEFVKELRDKLGEHKEHYDYLKDAYKQMFTLSPQKRIKTLPDVITPYSDNYGMFLLYELITAAYSFQEKTYALKKAGELNDIPEDKITDILEAILNARLSAWGLVWNSQTRTGTTANKSNELARADLSINFSNSRLIAEALRIYSYSSLSGEKQKIIDHILKVFNETSSPKYFYYLIYYQAKDFDSDWSKFFSEVLPEIKFPELYKRIEEPKLIEDENKPNLKTAFTIHDKDVTCYYLFINFNYAN